MPTFSKKAKATTSKKASDGLTRGQISEITETITEGMAEILASAFTKAKVNKVVKTVDVDADSQLVQDVAEYKAARFLLSALSINGLTVEDETDSSEWPFGLPDSRYSEEQQEATRNRLAGRMAKGDTDN